MKLASIVQKKNSYKFMASLISKEKKDETISNLYKTRYGESISVTENSTGKERFLSKVAYVFEQKNKKQHLVKFLKSTAELLAYLYLDNQYTYEQLERMTLIQTKKWLLGKVKAIKLRTSKDFLFKAAENDEILRKYIILLVVPDTAISRAMKRGQKINEFGDYISLVEARKEMDRMLYDHLWEF